MKILRISLFKTLIFNYHYLGISGLFRPVFIVGKHVRLRNMRGEINLEGSFSVGSIRLGFDIPAFLSQDNNPLIWNNSGTIIFHGRTTLTTGAVIQNDGILSIGASVSVNGNTKIICKKKVTIDEGCNISWGCDIMDTDFHTIILDGDIVNHNEEIHICSNVWIGSNTSILKGTYIGSNSVVGARTILSKKSIPSNVIVVGNGKIICNDINWKMELVD